MSRLVGDDMSNTYRALTSIGEAVFESGVFEREFTAAEEADWLNTGVLELVPRTYRVLSPNYVGPDGNAKQGDEFEAALTIGQEQSLLDGGHLERVEEKKPAKKAAAKKAAAKDDE